VLAVRESVGAKEGIKTLSTHVMDAIDSIQYMLEHPGQLRGLSTGYSKLDSMSSGLQGGEMFVIAARPSMGKTSLAMNIVEHIAVDCNTPCAVFSLEMSATMLVRRLLVSRARLSMQDLSRGLLSRAQQDALAKATRDLQKAQIFIDETPGLDIMEMRAKSRRLKKQHGIQMIMIDYLQLVTSQSRRAKDNRQIEIAEISAGIKGLAKELNVPIIVLAQLNRAVESRKGQRPVLSDLRESGSIEQDADMVGLLTRSDYAGAKMEVEDEEAEEKKKGEAMLISPKTATAPPTTCSCASSTTPCVSSSAAKKPSRRRRYFFSRSRISVSSTMSAAGAGGGASASFFFVSAISLLIGFTITKKTTAAVMRKLITRR
jgi:replicative DNA helicase